MKCASVEEPRLVLAVGVTPLASRVDSAVAPMLPNIYNLVQACCEPNNLLKRPSKHNDDFNIIEFTEKEDFRSPAGRLIATNALRGPHDTLFFTAPCTGGSKWTTLNRHKGGVEVNAKNVTLFWELWESFVIVLRHAEKVGARVLMELPRHCLYWVDSRISDVLSKYGFCSADFDGCQYGLTAKFGKEKGHPICKPWRIATLRSTLPSYLHCVCAMVAMCFLTQSAEVPMQRRPSATLRGLLTLFFDPLSLITVSFMFKHRHDACRSRP